MGFFIWTNLNFLHLRAHYVKFVWNLTCGFGDFFFKFRQCIFAIFYNLSLKMSGILILNKLESHLPKNSLCQICLKLTKCFSRRKFSKFQLEKGGALCLNKFEFPLRRILYAKFDWKWSTSSGEEDENVKFTDSRTARRTDDRRSEKLTWAFSSDEVIKWRPPEKIFVPGTIWLL